MFYDRFKQLCDDKGISCNRAALEIGLSNATVPKWKKTGFTPRMDTLNKIADYFNIPVYDLLGETEKPTAESSSGHMSDMKSSPQEQALLTFFRELNDEGAEKVLTFVRDLIASGNYKKCDSALLVDKPKAV